MVKYQLQLDLVFGSLANPTRRDIFQRVSLRELTVTEVAEHYKMSIVAISKHLKVLEKAQLIHKRQHGRQYIISADPAALTAIRDYLAQYEKVWNERFDALEELLNKKG
jgi:DNA-binding transcriptional ArsR family regulator